MQRLPNVAKGFDSCCDYTIERAIETDHHAKPRDAPKGFFVHFKEDLESRSHAGGLDLSP